MRPHYVHNPQPDQSLTQIICSVGHRFLSKRLTAPPALSYYSDRCLAPLPERIASSRDFSCGPLSGLSAHISHLSPTIQDGAHSALPRVASGVWWTREDPQPGGTHINIDRAVRWMHDDPGLSHRSVVLTLGIVKQVLDSKSRCASALYSAPPSPPTVDLRLPFLEHGHESEAEWGLLAPVGAYRR